jgi:heme-degrading monooxygenase HmoA
MLGCVSALAATPEPPYYAVIFTSTVTDDHGGYCEAAARMIELAERQPGFLGVESARDADAGITVSYWESEAAIAAWKAEAEHAAVRETGRERWYEAYELRVARVERAYNWRRSLE